ncbi:MAG TPA: MarR family transcriptional regulator [Candidatus Omnitrophota bacterium]|nr:MarR family transcriptional regulator [Candidatus Omnitrophota bacterium]HPS36677.1 MarR family transcriptional regulator [Candidatus Omnitrophota bacterium]
MGTREELAVFFREIQPKFARLYAKILHDADLTLPQYALLNQLEFLGPVSMTEMSERLQITRPAVTSLVDRLEKKKLLKRVPHPKDRRIILLDILPKAKKMVAGFQTYSLNLLFKAYDQFAPAEHATISRFYATLSKAMDDFLAREKK